MQQSRLPDFNPPRIWQWVSKANGIAIVILLAGISICLILFHYSVSRERDRARLDFRLMAEKSISSVMNKITENSTTVDAIASYFNASGHVSRHEFSDFVRPFLKKNSSIEALQWVPYVPDRDRARFEAAARRDGLSDFHFKEWIRPHVSKTARRRADYYVIYYNEPLAHSMAVIGVDNGSEPVRCRVLQDSAQRDFISYSPPVVLMLHKSTQKGYLVDRPVYDCDTALSTPKERLKHLRGFATGVFVMDEVLKSALGQWNAEQVYLDIVDVSDSQHYQLLGSVGIRGVKADMSYDQLCFLGNRCWRFHVVPSSSYFMPSYLEAWTRLIFSLILTCLVFVFVTYRTIAAGMLRESRDSYRDLVESINDVIFATDRRGVITYLSPQVERTFGYTPPELVGRSFKSLVYGPDLRMVEQGRHEILNGRLKPLAWRIVCKTGEIRWVCSSTRPVTDGKAVTGLRGMIIDITERKQIEDALQKTTDELQSFFTLALDLLCIADIDGHLLKLNTVWETTLGHPLSELRGAAFLDYVHPDDRQTTINVLSRMSRGDSVFGFVNRYRCKDGAYRWFEWHAIPDGNGLVYATARDETNRIEMEATLATERERLDTTLRSIGDGVISVDMDCNVTLMNPVAEALTGWDSKSAVGMPFKEVFNAVNRSSREGIDCPVNTVISTGLPQTLADSTVLISREGRERIIADSCAPIRNSSGAMTGVVLVFRDITEHKRNEAQIRLHSAAINAADDLIAILDRDGRIIFANDAFSRQTGRDVEEILGQDLSALCPHPQGICSEWDIWTAIEAGTAWKGEMLCAAKDASGYTADITVTPLADEKGYSEHLIVIARNITDRKIYEGQLDYQAHHDALTDLPNRLLFSQELASAVSHHGGKRGQFAVLFIDLDKFKQVNDTLGHRAGDVLLVETAARLRSCLKEDDVLARMGGDEFTVLLRNLNRPEVAGLVSQRILERVSVPYDIESNMLVIGASIGISIYPDSSADADGLLRAADAAMYRAKELGRNNYQFYSMDLSQASRNRVELEHDLRLAVERDELKVCYQPVIDARTMRITGAEALLRWDHPDKGMISPSLFIPIAEETELILRIGRMVLETACMQCKIIQDMGYSDFEISVNVSPIQLHKESFPLGVLDILDHARLSPHSLSLEITEAVLAGNHHGELDALRRLRELGMKTCLDDFGTGSSSLSRLKDLPIDYMKVNGAFVRHIEYSTNDKAMTQSIISMAHNLGVKVTAEWIENEEQMATIRLLDCDYAQGYLISPALYAETLEDFITKWTFAHQSKGAA
jgi:diguanylate cyclase (GGDEF)-like protein/PAS domain S-box-containing protein